MHGGKMIKEFMMDEQGQDIVDRRGGTVCSHGHGREHPFDLQQDQHSPFDGQEQYFVSAGKTVIGGFAMLKEFIRDEQGQDIVEYSLLLVLIGAAALFVLTAMGTSITSIFSKINTRLSAADSAIS
jgi:Flp pilus assembly pilin Flp